MVPLSQDAMIIIIVVVVVIVVLVVICVVGIFIEWWLIFIHSPLRRSVAFVESANNAPHGPDEKRIHANKPDMKPSEQLDNKSSMPLKLSVMLIEIKSVPNTIYQVDAGTLQLSHDLTFFFILGQNKKTSTINFVLSKRLNFDMIVYLSNHRSTTIIIIRHMCSLISSRRNWHIDYLRNNNN